MHQQYLLQVKNYFYQRWIVRKICSVHLQKLIEMKIFVAGLPYDLDDAELEEIFEKFGTVLSAKVAMDKETGKSKGFGFVEMPVSAEGKDAIESLNDISLGKKPLVVKEAEERSAPSSGGGRPGGGFNKPGGFNRPSSGGGFNNNRNRY
jgi:cold-inducible RNA-binding protein